MTTADKLIVKSNVFRNNDFIPIDYTGWGMDISPQLELLNISPKAKSIAIIMDDLDIPFIKSFVHWIIWNIPINAIIPEIRR